MKHCLIALLRSFGLSNKPKTLCLILMRALTGRAFLFVPDPIQGEFVYNCPEYQLIDHIKA